MLRQSGNAAIKKENALLEALSKAEIGTALHTDFKLPKDAEENQTEKAAMEEEKRPRARANTPTEKKSTMPGTPIPEEEAKRFKEWRSKTGVVHTFNQVQERVKQKEEKMKRLDMLVSTQERIIDDVQFNLGEIHKQLEAELA